MLSPERLEAIRELVNEARYAYVPVIALRAAQQIATVEVDLLLEHIAHLEAVNTYHSKGLNAA